MVNQLIVITFWPICIGTVIFILFWFILSQNRYINLPKALAKGFSGSRYVLTRGEQSGGISDFYYDIDTSITSQSSLKAIINFYCGMIYQANKAANSVDYLAFIEKDSGPVGALMLVSSLVEKTKISAIIVRMRKRLNINTIKGNGQYNNKRVILISDVATSGGGIKTATKKLEALGAKVVAAIVLVSRMDENQIHLDSGDITVYCAFKVREKQDLQQEPIKKYMDQEMEIAA